MTRVRSGSAVSTLNWLGAVALLAGCAGRGARHAALPRATDAPAFHADRSAARCNELEPLLGPLVRGAWVASASVALVEAEQVALCPFGEARPGEAATSETLYEIGSLTKLFTGLLLSSLVERGAVRLDEPVNALLPAEAALHTNGRPITLLDLAEQRSGLPRMPANFAPSNPNDPYLDYTEAQLFAFLPQAELAPADERHVYSNLGAAVLGQALAHRAGTPYATLLQQQILAPLGMDETFLSVPNARRNLLSDGHDADGVWRPGWTFDSMAPAGAIKSNARDLANFLKAGLSPNAAPLGPIFRRAEVPRVDASEGRRIGLFFLTRPDGSLFHDGLTGGFASYISLDPARRVGVALLLSSTFARANDLGDRVFAYARGLPLAPFDLPPSYQATSEELASYDGEYPLSPSFSIKVFHTKDALHTQATGQPVFRLWPSARDHFYLRVVDARVTFERDASRAVIALSIDQAGQLRRAVRKPLAASLSMRQTVLPGSAAATP